MPPDLETNPSMGSLDFGDGVCSPYECFVIKMRVGNQPIQAFPCQGLSPILSIISHPPLPLIVTLGMNDHRSKI